MFKVLFLSLILKDRLHKLVLKNTAEMSCILLVQSKIFLSTYLNGQILNLLYFIKKFIWESHSDQIYICGFVFKNWALAKKHQFFFRLVVSKQKERVSLFIRIKLKYFRSQFFWQSIKKPICSDLEREGESSKQLIFINIIK